MQQYIYPAVMTCCHGCCCRSCWCCCCRRCRFYCSRFTHVLWIHIMWVGALILPIFWSGLFSFFCFFNPPAYVCCCPFSLLSYSSCLPWFASLFSLHVWFFNPPSDSFVSCSAVQYPILICSPLCFAVLFGTMVLIGWYATTEPWPTAGLKRRKPRGRLEPTPCWKTSWGR